MERVHTRYQAIESDSSSTTSIILEVTPPPSQPSMLKQLYQSVTFMAHSRKISAEQRGFQNLGAAWQWGVLAGGRGAAQALSGGGKTKLNMLNVRATKLNSKEAHEVTNGHNAHYSKDSKDTITISMEWNQTFSQIKN